MNTRAITVFTEEKGSTRLVGSTFFHGHGSQLRTTFAYAQDWLSYGHAYQLSPQFPLATQSYQSRGLPGFLSDAAPDRWGRHLIFRGAQEKALENRVAMRSLDDVDYLLGVDDWSRMGALRISCDDGASFLGTGTDVPKLVRLPELLGAARSVSAGSDGWQQVKSLLEAGSSSLGGARPKATILDGETLLLAKFPNAHDEWDVITWEAWALEMASRAGLRVPPRRLDHVGNHAVLLERRFDRSRFQRIPYLSGLSALGLTDGAESDYFELGDTLRAISPQAPTDLEELFGRVVLSIALHNTDDHLRNHGLLHTGQGWQLSPMFDVNPNPFLAERRALPVFGEDGPSEVQALQPLGEAFCIPVQRQRAIISRVVGTFAYWKPVARRLGCSIREISLFEPVFADRVEALRRLA